MKPAEVCELVPLSSWRTPCRWAASPIQPDVASRSSSAPTGRPLPAALPEHTHITHRRLKSCSHIISNCRVKSQQLTMMMMMMIPLGSCSSSLSTWRRRLRGRTGWGSGRSRVPPPGAERLSAASPGSRSHNRWERTEQELDYYSIHKH